MRIEILDLARDDLIGGFHFYEEIECGVGDHFLTCLYSDIESLKTCAGSHRIAYRDFHRALSERFPFAIYYSMENEVIKIEAVVDCRRDPSWIRDHLKKVS